MRTEILRISKTGGSLCMILRPTILRALGLKYQDQVILKAEDGVATFTKLSTQDLAAKIDEKRAG